jgi:hypothetical protein
VEVADVIGKRSEEVFRDEELDVFYGTHGFILLTSNPVSFKQKGASLNSSLCNKLPGQGGVLWS